MARIQDSIKRLWQAKTAARKCLGDTLIRWTPTVATLIGGIWVYQQFSLSGGTDWTLNPSIETEVLRYKGDLALVVVHVRVKNPLNKVVDIHPANGKFDVRIKKTPADQASATVIDPDDDGELIAHASLLPEDGYEFLPNADFDNVTSVVLPTGMLVSITADIQYHDDYVSVSRIVRVKPEDEKDAAPPSSGRRSARDTAHAK